MELDRELIVRAKRGDTAAQEELVSTLAPLVFRLASRFFRSREDVEDLAQEAFSRFFLKIDQVHVDENVLGWVSRVTINVCYDRLRKLQREKAAMETYVAEPRVSQISNEPGIDDYEDVRKAVEQLDPKFRIPLLLKEVDELSVEEISNIMGLTQANVKIRLFRARKMLAGVLGNRAGRAGQLRDAGLPSPPGDRHEAG
jgi:RNA polymerase sigma-70 factor (ECF subfamily)